MTRGYFFQGLSCEEEAISFLGLLQDKSSLVLSCKRRNRVPPVSLGSSEPHKFCTEERAWELGMREGEKCDVLAGRTETWKNSSKEQI